MPSFDSPPSRQLFSIPYNYVLYVIENPTSSKLLKNLYQTCKYFVVINQILITPSLFCNQNGFSYISSQQCLNKSSAKFWPISRLIISTTNFSQKFYRFSPKYLSIETIALSLKEFDFIVAENTVLKFNLMDASIENATIDVVLQKMKKVTDFDYDNPRENYSVETLQKLYSIQKNRNLPFFRFMSTTGYQTWSSSSIFVLLVQKEDTAKSKFLLHLDKHLIIELAEEIQRMNPNIFKVDILPKFVSVKFL